jgi:hypothetical protein
MYPYSFVHHHSLFSSFVPPIHQFHREDSHHPSLISSFSSFPLSFSLVSSWLSFTLLSPQFAHCQILLPSSFSSFSLEYLTRLSSFSSSLFSFSLRHFVPNTASAKFVSFNFLNEIPSFSSAFSMSAHSFTRFSHFTFSCLSCSPSFSPVFGLSYCSRLLPLTCAGLEFFYSSSARDYSFSIGLKQEIPSNGQLSLSVQSYGHVTFHWVHSLFSRLFFHSGLTFDISSLLSRFYIGFSHQAKSFRAAFVTEPETRKCSISINVGE